jgi:hypothetical protein
VPVFGPFDDPQYLHIFFKNQWGTGARIKRGRSAPLRPRMEATISAQLGDENRGLWSETSWLKVITTPLLGSGTAQASSRLDGTTAASVYFDRGGR